MNVLALSRNAIWFCLFLVVGFSVFAGSDRRIGVDEGGAGWDSINGGEELLRIKKSKGTKIRNGSKRIERMKDRSSDECIFFCT